MNIIEIDNIAKYYYHRNRELLVLKKITFPVEEGKIISIIGKSGCGKTTLLKVIAGLIAPSAGKVKINDNRIGYIPQNLALVPWLDVYHNASLPFCFSTYKKCERQKARIEEALKIVGLWEFRDYYINQLSGGMQQKLALARSLVLLPSVLLMDEPFKALDELSRFQLNQELLRIWKVTKTTIVFVTHSVSEAVFLSSRVLLMSDRPAIIERTFEVGLGYPRDQSILNQKYFLEKREEIKSFFFRY